MKCFIGIDLGYHHQGSDPDEKQKILGRGITNSRSNYDIAAAVAKRSLVDTRINLVRQSLQPIASRFKNLEEFLRTGTDLPAGTVPGPTRRPGIGLPHECFGNRFASRKKPSSLRLCVKSSASFGQKHRCCLHLEQRKSDFFGTLPVPATLLSVKLLPGN